MTTIGPVTRAVCVGAVLCLGAAQQRAWAQEADWPCQQRLIPKLEAGQMWSGPPLPTVEQPGPELQVTVRRLIDVKLPPDSVAAEVKGFAAQQPEAGRTQALSELFALSLDWLNDERDVRTRGIKHYAANQKAMADRIVAETRALSKLQAQAGADATGVADLETAKQWDMRIYGDRQRSLSLVCEQPVEIEQRAFTLARVIQEQLP